MAARGKHRLATLHFLLNISALTPRSQKKMPEKSLKSPFIATYVNRVTGKVAALRGWAWPGDTPKLDLLILDELGYAPAPSTARRR